MNKTDLGPWCKKYQFNANMRITFYGLRSKHIVFYTFYANPGNPLIHWIELLSYHPLNRCSI